MGDESILDPPSPRQSQNYCFPGQTILEPKGKQKEGTALEGRKKINKNVNLVEKSCPKLAVGRDKTGLAAPWLTGKRD
jgi:hypothetical protein